MCHLECEQNGLTERCGMGGSPQYHSTTKYQSGPFPVINPEELASEQRKDPVIGKILTLKERTEKLTEEACRILDRRTWKLSQE